MLTNCTEIWWLWLVCHLTCQCWRRISLKSDVVCLSYGNVYRVTFFCGHSVYISKKRAICRTSISAKISWCSLSSRSMMLQSIHTENTRLISRGIIFDVIRPIWSRYLTSRTHFVNFAAFTVSMTLNLTLRSSKVIHFSTNRKRVYDNSYWTSIVTLVLSWRVSDILVLLYAESCFFDIPPLFRPKFQGISNGLDPCCWGMQRANTSS